MSKLLLGVFLSANLFSISGFAQEDSSSPQTVVKENEETEQEIAARKAWRNRLYGSQVNREGKDFQVDLTLGGHYYGFEIESALSFYKFLGTDRLIGLTVGYQEEDDEDFWVYKGTTVELSYKQFEGNTFYFEPSLFYRTFTGADWYSSLTGTRNGEVEAEDLGIGFKIGNQWQWKNLTVGCDWIGIGKRIAILSERELTDDDSDVMDDMETTYTWLNFYVGVSF